MAVFHSQVGKLLRTLLAPAGWFHAVVRSSNRDRCPGCPARVVCKWDACRETHPLRQRLGPRRGRTHAEKHRGGRRESCPHGWTLPRPQSRSVLPSCITVWVSGGRSSSGQWACVHWGALSEQLLRGVRAAAGQGRGGGEL